MITSSDFKNAVISAAQSLKKREDEINGLNVFPVPDGDTGTNLSLTLSGCADAIADCNEPSISAVADKAAEALLRYARGNSGVILALIFKGFAQSIKGLEVLDAHALANALEAGCNEAYSCIDKPTEGTILTVIRLAASKAISAAQKGKNAKETFNAAVSGAKASLKSTPNLLPVLKKHGVVDAGGQGLVYIMESMTKKSSDYVSASSKPDIKSESDEIKFMYCTEFLINTAQSETGDLKKYFSQIGDCSAVVPYSDFIKIHIHTNNPDKALAKGLEYGELTNIKIDNMKIQSNRTI